MINKYAIATREKYAIVLYLISAYGFSKYSNEEFWEDVTEERIKHLMECDHGTDWKAFLERARRFMLDSE